MAPITSAPEVLCFVTLVLVLSSAGVLGCATPHMNSPCKMKSLVSVSDATNPAVLPALNTSMTKEEVLAHYQYQAPFQYAHHLKTSFACVDAREDSEILGTPGGDFAELVMAAHVYFKQVHGLTLTETEDASAEAKIDALFNTYVADAMTPERPLYFHTDEIKLGHMYEAVAARGVEPPPSILPASEPQNETEREIWYEEWTVSAYQGCGHIRLMLQNPTAYGLDATFIPRALLRAFLRYWWTHPHGSAARAKISPWFKLNKLAGRAVSIINPTGSCPGYSPVVAGNKAASSVFIYHPTAIKDFRANFLVPWFKRFDDRVDATTYQNALNALADTMLNATLTLLPPANNVPIFSVTIEGVALTNAELSALQLGRNGLPVNTIINNDNSGVSGGAAAGIAIGSFFGGILLAALLVGAMTLSIMKVWKAQRMQSNAASPAGAVADLMVTVAGGSTTSQKPARAF